MNRDQVDANLDSNTANSRVGGTHFGWIACISGVFAIAIFFRQFLISGFNLIDGNTGDNRFVITILEHWGAVMHGQAAFRSPNFFWPERGVLGYSESMFLLFPPYALGRIAGMDQYLAFEIALILFKFTGFLSILWLLRSFLGVARPVALVGSLLFTLSNLYFISAGHGHLMTVEFIPLLVCLACAAWRALALGRRALAYVYASAFGLLLALVLFTSFYVGWFALFAAALVVLSTLAVRFFLGLSPHPLQEAAYAIVSKFSLITMAMLVFAVAITPFFMTYLPTLKRTGGRSFKENLFYTAQPIDLINIGQLNWLWGPSLESLFVRSGNKPMVPSEAEMGWPPVTLFVVATGIFLSVRRKSSFSRAGFLSLEQHSFFAALSLAFLVGWLLSIKVHELSLWWLVFKFIPGGAAIRVPARFNLVLNILVVLSTCLLLNDLNRRSKLLFWILSLVLLTEQINTAPVHEIDRTGENAILERVHYPPSACRSFFLDTAATTDRPWYANQIDAMLIARKYNLPTVNGYSGWLPANWRLSNVDDDSIENARAWVVGHTIAAGVCSLNMRSGSWTQVDFRPKSYLLGSVIDFHRGGNAKYYKTDGWGEAEAGGAWNLGKRSVLLLNLPELPAMDLLLTFKAHAFVVPKRPKFGERLQINENDVSHWIVTDSQFEKQVRIPHGILHSRQLHVAFIDEDPQSPAELGYSADIRQLGLAIETLSISPINQP